MGRPEEAIIKYSLQLLRRFCKLGVKKSKIPDLGIIELMFADMFFRYRLHSEWQELWDFLSSMTERDSWLHTSIFTSLNSLVPTLSYLQGLIAFVSQKINSAEAFIPALVDLQLFSYIFEGLLKLGESKETCIELFMMIKAFLYAFDPAEKLNSKISEFLLNDSLINNEDFYELSLSCFGALLRNSGLPTYEALVILLNNTSRLPVLEKILETVQSALKELEYKQRCQNLLGKVGIFRSFKKLLQDNLQPQAVLVLWPAVLECVRFLIQGNQKNKRLLSELDFRVLTQLVLNELLAVSEALSLACIEIVLYILFDDTNLQVFHEVKNPEIVPLAVAMFSCCDSQFAQYVLSVADYSFNAVQIANAGCMAVINQRLAESDRFRVLASFMEKTLCYSLKPVDLAEFLVVCKELPMWKQEVVFRAFASGAEKAFVNNEDAESGFNSVSLAPTVYFWFNKNASHITLSSESFQFFPKKDFTIITWALPLSRSQTCLCTFIDRRNFVQIFTEDNSLIFQFTCDKKLQFRLRTSKALLESQWNLICISCQQISKFITTQSSYSVFINNRECELTTEGKACGLSAFNTLVLGNSYDLESCFIGKIASFSIFSKAFAEFSDIYSCSNYKFLPFVAQSHAVTVQVDQSKFKDLWSEVWFDLNAKNSELAYEEIFVDFQAEHINGVDIVSSLALLGGANVFLPLLKDSENKVAIEILAIVSCLCPCRVFERLVHPEFFSVLAGILEPLVLPCEELLETLKRIVARLDWNPELQSQAFKSLMINSAIWNNLNENLQENYVGTVSLHISRHLTCSLEDVIEFYTHITALAPVPVDLLTEVFIKIVPKLLEPKDFDGFCFLLFKLANDDVEVLNSFLQELAGVSFAKECLREATFVFLNFLEWPFSENIASGLLAVFKRIIGQLASDLVTDKKTLAEDDTFKQVFVAFDKKYGFEYTKELFLAVPQVLKLICFYTNRHLADKSLSFLERIAGKPTLLELPSEDEYLSYSIHSRTASAPEYTASAVQSFDDSSKNFYNFVINKQDELKNSAASLSTRLNLKRLIREKKFKRILKWFATPEEVDFGRAKAKLRSHFDSLGRMATCSFQQKFGTSSPRKPTMVSTPTKLKNSYPGHNRNELLFETFTDDTETLMVAETEEEVVEENIPELVQSVVLDCERIKVTCSVYGYIEISQDNLVFHSEGKEKPEGGIYFPSALKFMQECKKSFMLVKVAEIAEVFPRRFIHQHSAFEVYLHSGKSFLFNVFSTENREKAFEAMRSWKFVKIVTDPSGSLLRSYTKKWKRGELSNLSYLLIVNKFASRSFHDLSQYPVFPWVLKDYSSPDLHLDDSSTYRNLKLPIGAQTEEAREEAEQRFTMGLDDHPYHFGSHYSSGAVVLHYLLRIEPFGELARNLQGGSFDIPDRLFHSVLASWLSGQGATGDVKELIPEMFYLPEIFINSNQEHYGPRQDGDLVNHVRLPPWASCPEDFVQKHLAALESAFVSQNLNHWIDLVFGAKQKGKQARQATNVFLPMSYEDNFKKVLESGESESYLQGMAEQVVHFGQIPIKLFHSAHVTKDLSTASANIFDKYRKLDGNFNSGCQVSGEVCAVLLTSKYLLLVKKGQFKVTLLRISLNDLDENSVMFERKKEKTLQGCKFTKSDLSFNFCTLGENKLVSGHHFDLSFKVHSLNGNLLSSVFEHTALVSCVCSSDHSVFTGSLDGSAVSWSLSNNKPSVLCRYLGHRSGIKQICLLPDYSLVFTLNIAGHVLVHDCRTGEFLQMLKTRFSQICVSSQKLVAGIESGSVSVINTQKTQVFKKIGNFQMISFDLTGEHLCYCKDFAWGFWSIFDEHKKYEKKEDGFLTHFLIASKQNYFIYSLASGKYSFVYTYGVVNKDNLMPSSRINF